MYVRARRSLDPCLLPLPRAGLLRARKQRGGTANVHVVMCVRPYSERVIEDRVFDGARIANHKASISAWPARVLPYFVLTYISFLQRICVHMHVYLGRYLCRYAADMHTCIMQMRI